MLYADTGVIISCLCNHPYNQDGFGMDPATTTLVDINMTDVHIAIRMIGSSILQEANVPARTGKGNWNNEMFEKIKGGEKIG
jgi:hypothetical protein